MERWWEAGHRSVNTTGSHGFCGRPRGVVNRSQIGVVKSWSNIWGNPGSNVYSAMKIIGEAAILFQPNLSHRVIMRVNRWSLLYTTLSSLMEGQTKNVVNK